MTSTSLLPALNLLVYCQRLVVHKYFTIGPRVVETYLVYPTKETSQNDPI